MKSIKFLAALALPAMFAACTNDDLVAVQEDMQQNAELVGADLIGTGVSMKIGSGIESRLSGTAWSTTDKLGLGWIVTGSYNSVQTEDGVLTDNALYANHMFECIGDNVFKTKGNLFKGWHFGYFPFEYMEEIGKVKKVTINPTQTEEWISDRYNTALHLSPREFLTKDDLDKDYQLEDHVVYQLYRSVNTIGVTINPSTMFTGSDVLKDLVVKEINLNVGQGVFYRQANLSPVKLSRIQYDEDGNWDKNKDKEEFYKALPGAFDFTGISAYKNITTNVENSGINMSGAQTLRIYTLPLKKTLSAEDVKFTIKVEGGLFTVGYAKGDELSAEEEHNNAAIEAFVEACAAEGALTEFPGILLLDLQLTGDMFEADFSSIKSEEEWNKAVKIADALEMEEVEFTIAAADEEGNNWAFMDVDGDGNLINLPEGELTVKGQKMILGAEGEWPTEGLTVETDIDVIADLTVAGTMDVAENSTITNKATIFAGAESSISSKSTDDSNSKVAANALNNAEGRVVVEYGAYVYASMNNEGTIAYVVENAEAANVARINTLILGGTNDERASVNTLIVKTSLPLNAVAKAAVEDTRYDIVVPAVCLTSLKDINIELEGGSISAPVNFANNKVNEILVVNGENTITNIDITKDLNVEGGKVIVDADAANNYKIAVTIDNISIKSGAELVGNVDIYTDNISIPTGAKATVTNPWTIWYTGEYEQGGMTSGRILLAKWNGIPKEPNSEIVDKKNVYNVSSADELVWLARQQKVNSSIINLTCDIDMAGVNWTNGIHAGDGDFETIVDGGGYTIFNLNGTSGLLDYSVGTIKNLTIDGANIGNNDFIGVLSNNNYANIENVVVKNVKVEGTKRVGAVVGIHNGGSIKGCEVENATLSGECYSAGVISGFVNETNKNRIYENCIVKNSLVDAVTDNKGSLTGAINMVTLTIKNIEVKSTTPSEYIGGFYNGGKLIEE